MLIRKSPIVLVVILLVAFFLAIDNYFIVYIGTLLTLVSIYFYSKKFTVRLASIFYLFYFGIGAANISSYRGEISAKTVSLYSSLILISLIPFLVYNIKESKTFNILRITKNFEWIAKIHLTIVWACLFLIFILYGNVLLNQEIRFRIPPSIGYIVKSALAISLFFPFKNSGNKFRNIVFYFIIPILPSLIIGSRGNVIMILICTSLIYIIHNKSLLKFKENFKKIKLKRLLFRMSFLGIIIIFPLFYIRRLFNSSLMNPLEMIKAYSFPSDSWFYLFILPLHTAFRETIGISNIIINNEYTNEYTNTPLIFQELNTLLPGDNIAPGQILAKEIIGSVLDGGLTPGILGGTYIDFGIYSILSGAFFTFFIALIVKKSMFHSFYLLLGSLCFVEYFHLFHRGFLKPEYFTYILIVLIYFRFCRMEKIVF